MCKSIAKGLKSKRNQYDVVVIGGGIIGTAIANRAKRKFRNCHVALLEKETTLGQHQSSHNSGVIHAGIYYKPGSLKSKLCVEGARLVYDYCNQRKIPYIKCGKLIVATDDDDVKILNKVHRRGLENKVPDLQLLKNTREIQTFEPNCRGIKALWSPFTGNINWKLFTEHLGREFEESGGQVKLLHKVNKIKESYNPSYPIAIHCENSIYFEARYLIQCAGLHSEELSNLLSSPGESKILSFRVNYKILNSNKKDLVRTNVYAVPNLPFLGPHFSPRLDGNVLLGPSAIPAFDIEAYNSDDISLPYIRNTIGYPGFQKMVRKNLFQSFTQVTKFLFKKFQAGELRKIVPSIEDNDVTAGPSAVQAQAIDGDGEFVDDFVIDFFKGPGINKRIINCRFIPSPGATSCLALSKYVVDKMPPLNSSKCLVSTVLV